MTASRFTPATAQFLRDLAANNNKDWFEAHKEDYRSHLLAPLEEMALVLGDTMRQDRPGIHHRAAPGNFPDLPGYQIFPRQIPVQDGTVDHFQTADETVAGCAGLLL